MAGIYPGCLKQVEMVVNNILNWVAPASHDYKSHDYDFSQSVPRSCTETDLASVSPQDSICKLPIIYISNELNHEALCQESN